MKGRAVLVVLLVVAAVAATTLVALAGPGAGSQVQPAAGTNDANVVPAGRVSVKVAFKAALGPALKAANAMASEPKYISVVP